MLPLSKGRQRLSPLVGPSGHAPNTCCPQTKETLTSKASSFGSKCELTPQLLEKISK